MRYLATALAAALLAALAAWFLVREREAKRVPAVATFEQRFPEQTAAYHQPASVDARWHENRGHAWSIEDREETDPQDGPRWTRILGARPKLRPQPAACLTCHAVAGTARAATYYEARDRKPLGCPDCHERQGDLRSAVCEQCHREYYIVAGQAAFPEGHTADEIEAFYERRGIADWVHAGTGAAVLKAQHPQSEMYAQGPHARAGVACADCHMPFERRGATRITGHRATRPLENAGRACLPCHRESADDLLVRVKETEQRTRALLERAEDALIAAIEAIQAAQAAGGRPAAALKLETKAQWRIDFVAADRSLGFHAPQESARLLAEAIDYARQAQFAAARSAVE
jgi:formate-dependent nitrite reductase cytochrome c552 subunit